MSRAYRKWKEDIKKFRRGEWFEVRDGYIILLCDTSLSAYRQIRRVREREIKRMNKNSKILNDFMTHRGIYSFGNTTPDPDWHKHFLDTSGYPEYWKEDKQ